MLLWKLRETCYAYNLVCIVCSWSPSHALNLPEEVPNPDALYSSLDMLTDDLPPATQNDSHSAATKRSCKLLEKKTEKDKQHKPLVAAE